MTFVNYENMSWWRRIYIYVKHRSVVMSLWPHSHFILTILGDRRLQRGKTKLESVQEERGLGVLIRSTLKSVSQCNILAAAARRVIGISEHMSSPLKPISVTPDHRSVPRLATSRSRSSQFLLHPLAAPLPPQYNRVYSTPTYDRTTYWKAWRHNGTVKPRPLCARHFESELHTIV